MSIDRKATESFARQFSGRPSTVTARVFADALGEDYPAGLDTHSFTTWSELTRIAQELQVGDRGVLLDVGCGRAGPGIYVGLQTGAHIVGVDIVDVAHGRARERAADLGVDAEFRMGSFEDTGLEDGSADAVMSVDALLFTPDKHAAFRELARVIRPGGRLVFTSFDFHDQPPHRPPQVDDHRPVAEQTGFEVLAYEETPGWRHAVDATTSRMLESVDELAAEAGEDPTDVRGRLEEMQRVREHVSRRVLFVGRRV